MSDKLYIGTSGFYYEHWRGIFYPLDLPKNKLLSFYVQHFNTLELNATFYHLPKTKSVQHWNEQAPQGFLYSIKAYRAITHYKKLHECKDELYRFLHLVKPLKPHLGMILFQLPPSLHYDLELLSAFLHLLPQGYHYAMEFRHSSWYTDEVFKLLRHYNVALCLHDFGRKSMPLIATSSDVYIRLHGPNGHYGGSYNDEALQQWAKLIRDFLDHNKRIFCYFNNDYEGNAINDAKRLLALLATE
ncbi:DUF72 domain-containing protein [Nitratiruptor sp. YY09-18]|uniref:DUF72 domain-containing protein n=1 Tax=Nitratiruptor sp. YY09-18 TaxID=2724901 RepID=UPI0019163497|nr:DUF72 domain-containing protein [Nitratiruptor sp. YY09-18]BCD67706.1 hypothetical protein NitYY0918_C0607 [Nitratiruptor sp. YY09-18]